MFWGAASPTFSPPVTPRSQSACCLSPRAARSGDGGCTSSLPTAESQPSGATVSPQARWSNTSIIKTTAITSGEELSGLLMLGSVPHGAAIHPEQNTPTSRPVALSLGDSRRKINQFFSSPHQILRSLLAQRCLQGLGLG